MKMKKISIFIVLALFVMTFNVSAENFEFIGGSTISKISTEYNINQGVNSETTKKDFSGFGFYIGGRYIFDNGFGLGGGYETVSFSHIQYNYEYRNDNNYGEERYIDYYEITSPYVEVVYDINEFFTVRGTININNFTQSNESYWKENGLVINNEEEDVFKGSGVGYQIGAEVNYPLLESLSVVSSVSYIIGSLDFDKVYNPYEEIWYDIEENIDMSVDYSGFKFALGLNYSL